MNKNNKEKKVMSQEFIYSQTQIESRIYNIRGYQVMLDSDLAEMYAESTTRLNQQVNRNIFRFPNDFMFQLTESEWLTLRQQITSTSLGMQNRLFKDNNLMLQNATSSIHGGRRKLPYVFTEQGVAGLSGVLRSETAAIVHIEIMRAFVTMRKIIHNNHLIYTRLDKIELKQLETDQKFGTIFMALEKNVTIPTQGLFFDGQVFDAYELTSKIIRSAKQSIILIDNYIDETTITHLTKKNKDVRCLILTKGINRQLTLDINKANQQYGDFDVKVLNQSHDRFLIIDDLDIYHLGASLKDLGKKWFAFSKIDKVSVDSIIRAVNETIFERGYS
jgi:hypothetical protein